MAVDERLFAALSRRWRAWRHRPSPAIAAATVAVGPLLPRLKLVASAVAGVDLEIRLHDGGMLIAGDRLWLPTSVAELPTADENLSMLRVAVTFAAMTRRLAQGAPMADHGVAWIARACAVEDLTAPQLPGWAEQRAAIGPGIAASRPDPSRLDDAAALVEAVIQHRLGRSLASLVPALSASTARLLEAAIEPGAALAEIVARRWGPHRDVVIEPVPIWGRLEAGQPDVEAFDGAVPTPSPSTTERQSRPRGPVRRRRLPERSLDENPLTHSFEKVHTAEEHPGGHKRADGSDELADHHTALEELDLDEVVLSNERTASTYSADLVLLGESTASPGAADGLRYDEWDERRRGYLARHCRLVVETGPTDLAAGLGLAARVRRDHSRASTRVREELARLCTARRWIDRQRDGSDIDIDMVVDRLASLRAGHDGGDRLYLRRLPRSHDLAVLLLVDASLSTDAWVADRRVLDTVRDATTILALALDGWIAELGIAGFCSFTHDDCRFIGLKGFAEPTPVGLGRLAGLRPAGYTRIGPAVRHATVALGRTRARRRLLVLLTDAKPTDADRYEGRHGIGDVRQAVREAARASVDTFALAVDPRAAATLPAMFGARGWADLRSVDRLAGTAAQLFARAMRR